MLAKRVNDSLLKTMTAIREYSPIEPHCRYPLYNGLEEEGCYYFNARWYDANTGRFISEDPARDGQNWYVYVSNNPIVNYDPSGKETKPYPVDGYEDGVIFRPDGDLNWTWFSDPSKIDAVDPNKAQTEILVSLIINHGAGKAINKFFKSTKHFLHSLGKAVVATGIVSDLIDTTAPLKDIGNAWKDLFLSLTKKDDVLVANNIEKYPISEEFTTIKDLPQKLPKVPEKDE